MTNEAREKLFQYQNTVVESNYIWSFTPNICMSNVQYLSKVSNAHQGCIYLFKNTIKITVFYLYTVYIYIYTHSPKGLL